MTIESKIEAAQKLIEEAKAELAAMRAEKAAPPRNWPERIEAGDCFEDRENSRTWLAISEKTFCCVTGVKIGFHAYGHRDEWIYRGRDILTIRTEAHEPTGVELVADGMVSIPRERWDTAFGAILWGDSSAYWGEEMKRLREELRAEKARPAR